MLSSWDFRHNLQYQLSAKASTSLRCRTETYHGTGTNTDHIGCCFAQFYPLLFQFRFFFLSKTFSDLEQKHNSLYPKKTG